MVKHNINADIRNLSTDELMSCYQTAFDRLDQADKENMLDCVDQLLPIKNMGVVSAWELLSKLGIILMDHIRIE